MEEVENNDDKSNLVPLSYTELRTYPAGSYFIRSSGYGFSSQADIDYWFFPSPDISDNIENLLLWVRFDMFVYTLNPESSTWVKLLFETSEENFEGVIEVEVPRGQFEENVTVNTNEIPGITLGETFAKNIYAIWENGKIPATSPINHAYKKINDQVLIRHFYQNQTSIDTITSMNLTEETSWRLAKYKLTLFIGFQDKSSNIVANDMFLRVFSPLGLTYSYEFFYELSGEDLSKILYVIIPWPIYIIVATFLAGVSILFTKRKKLKRQNGLHL